MPMTNGSSFTLTNSIIIQGYGVIGSNAGPDYQNLNLINNRTINANSGGNILSIQGTGSTITNANVLEATNGGILNLATANPLNNSVGSITASGSGSAVNISNTTIQGGTLTTEAGGAMNMVGTSKLDGSSQGAITLTDGSTLTSGPTAFTEVLGTVNLGTSSGSTLNVSSGNFTQGATGTLNEQVAGTGAGQFGVTDVFGTANLAAGSTLDVTFLPSFDAAMGDDYILTFLDATGGLTGTYSNADLNCPVNDTCTLGYTADTAFLGVDGPTSSGPPPATPEPSTFVMMLSGLGSLAAGIKMRNRRRNASA
jgi:hypothetical protein